METMSDPVFLTLNQAAEFVKKSKSIIFESIHSERLPAFKNNKKQWQIKEDDLYKLFPNTEQKSNEKTKTDSIRPIDKKTDLKQKIEYLEQRVNDILGERDDLRRRLNDEVVERRKLNEFIEKAFCENVLALPFSRILDLTVLQCKLFITFFENPKIMKSCYYEHNFDTQNFRSRFGNEKTEELRENGILELNQDYKYKASEKFIEVTRSVLKNRQFEDLSINDIVEIAKRCS